MQFQNRHPKVLFRPAARAFDSVPRLQPAARDRMEDRSSTVGVDGAMLARRFATAIGLLLAVVFSQAPEFVQQYRQRLGGAVDELRRAIALFDAEATAQALSRDAGIARLRANADPLVQGRGIDLQGDVERERRLEAQGQAFEAAGPIGRYWVFVERFDADLAGRAYAVYQPAVPVTAAGFAAAAAGFVAGYGGIRLAAAPFGRRRKVGAAAA